MLLVIYKLLSRNKVSQTIIINSSDAHIDDRRTALIRTKSCLNIREKLWNSIPININSNSNDFFRKEIYIEHQNILTAYA